MDLQIPGIPGDVFVPGKTEDRFPIGVDPIDKINDKCVISYD